MASDTESVTEQTTQTPEQTQQPKQPVSGDKKRSQKKANRKSGAYEQQMAELNPHNEPTFAQQEAILAPEQPGPVTEVPVDKAASEDKSVEATVTPEEVPQGISPAFEDKLGVWRPAFVKATDPVAFMTSKSYNKAILNGKNDQAGFYSLAIAELDRLGGEFSAFTGEHPELRDFEMSELSRMVALAGAWKNLYATIRDTNDKPSAREALTETALAAAEGVQSHLNTMTPDILGLSALTRIDATLDEIRTFLGSWSVLAGSDSSAAKPMWASFLQTTQRYRMILCEYGALEERGGDTKDTSKLAVKGDKGMAKDRETADRKADEAGGYMVLAMQTYSYSAANQAGLKKQIDAITERIGAGEFKTLEDAQKVARQEIGGGRASESYYKMVANYVAAAWHERNAGHEKVAGDLATFDGVRQTAQGAKATDRGGAALDKSKSAAGQNKTSANDGMKEEADLAWANAQKYKKQAEDYQAKADQHIKAGGESLNLAAEHYARSKASIETAKNHLEFVDVKRRSEFAGGVAQIEGGLKQTESGLAVSQERLAEAQALHNAIANRAAAQRSAIDKYNPTQMEVEVPGFLSDSEVSTFAKGSLSVSARIPGAPFIKIAGSAEVEGGVKDKGGAKWGYLKNDWSLGLEIDLILFTLTAAYVAGSNVEAKDKLSPPSVLAAGEEERANYTAKKEIWESGAVGRLQKAFDTGHTGMVKTFGKLKQAGELLRTKSISRGEYKTLVWGSAIAARSVQSDVRLGVFSAFGKVSNMMDALTQAQSTISPDEVYEKTLELGDAEAETAAKDIDIRGQAFDVANSASYTKAKEPMDTIANYTNDPNVTFSDYGGWELGATAGGAGFEIGVKYQNVNVTSDGDGELYDFSEKNQEIVSLNLMTPGYEGEISVTFQNGELLEGGISGTATSGNNLGDEERDTITKKAGAFKENAAAIWKNLKSDKTALVKALGKAFSTFFGSIKDLFLGKANITGKVNPLKGSSHVIIGFDFSKNGPKTDVHLRLGTGTKLSREMSVGVFEIEAEMVTGQEGKFLIGQF